MRGSSQFLSVEIPSTENSTLDRWKNVTLYDVRISAIGRREFWAVFRRYSKFYDLRCQLQKRFPNQMLPPIPPKRLLGKEDPQFIAQRRQELGEFLNALLRQTVDISLSEELCLFLEVPEPLRLSLLEAADVLADPSHFAYPAAFEGGRATGTSLAAKNFSSLQGALEELGGPSSSPSQDSKRVHLLLALLQDLSNNKVAVLRTFESWILRSKPQLSEVDVQLLYLGCELQGGLLEEVGALEHSEVSAMAALSLLNRLLSHEYCSEAPLFRRVLHRLDPAVLARARLCSHILRDRGQNNRLDAFQVLQSLEPSQEKLMTVLQHDEFTFGEFQRWKESQNNWLSLRTLHQPATTSRRFRVNSHNEPSSSLPGKVLSTQEYRRLAGSAFTSVRMCLSTFTVPQDDVISSIASYAAKYSKSRSQSDGSLVVSRTLSDVAKDSGRSVLGRSDAAACPPATSATPASGGDGTAGQPAGQQQRWHIMQCPEPSWKSRYGLRVAYQQVTPELEPDASYILRGSLQLPHSALLVASLLADHAAFIRQALEAADRAMLPSYKVKQLKALADGQLILQMQDAAIVEPVRLGYAFEICSEVVECNLAVPSAPHNAMRLSLLKSVQLLPAGAVGGETADWRDSGSSGSGGALTETRSSSPDHVSVELSETALPAYLLVCAAVHPGEACGREEDPRTMASGAATRDSGFGRAIPENAHPKPNDADAQGEATATRKPALPVPELQLAAASLRGANSQASNNLTPMHSPKTRMAPSKFVDLKPCGVQVKPAFSTDVSACEVNFCAILGKDSVRLLSGDLLGERLLFWRTLENLLFVLEELCPLLPQNFIPPLLAQQEQTLQRDTLGTPPSSPHSGSSAGDPALERSLDEELEVQLVEVSSNVGAEGESVVFD
eukprot:TRINITY_DN28804_c0_g1_i1.p1 TRINITY_DN28804_c0_g1~~TRINITY_DN28804_c0_g1_i1.p1  ORF type:complete len:897 (+),score=148.03 TRINITY_DN28804_c0_g1_i1:37-2727(+)